MSGKIRVERTDGIATVIVDHPERMNAVTYAMWGELAARLEELGADASLRCVIIRGGGEAAFASGADLNEFVTSRRNAAEARTFNVDVTRAVDLVGRLPHPTIAAIQGICVGAAIAIVSRCDLRIANASAKFGAPVNRLGFGMPATEMRPIYDAIGHLASARLLFEGVLVDAEEALRLGIVGRVVADDAFAAEIAATADRIAAGAPLVNRLHKQLLRRLADPAPLTAADQEPSFAICDSEDYRNGVEAFLARKKPVFKGK